jgi:phenylpyruvate tautomerase PptA (4-oxalocrotonate tautomerase family)
MAGKTGPAAFLDIRSIGSINSRVNRKISQDVTLLLQSALGIPSDRVYLSFNDVDGANWGWNGSTFG